MYDACSGLRLGSVSSFDELSREIVGKEKWIPLANIAHWNAIDINSAKHVRNEKAFDMATILHLIAYSQSGAIIQTAHQGKPNQ